jgi:opacity protein-like surface antigen
MKNFSTKLLLATVVSLSLNVQAETLPFSGLFGQVGVGYNGSSTTASGSTVVSSVPVLGDYNVGKSYNFAESLALGYNYVIDPKVRLGLGFEYNIMIASPRQDVTLKSGNTTAILGQSLQKNAYNFFLAPGYVIGDDGLAYAKLGISRSRADILGDTINFKGYTFGIGYKYAVTSNIFVFGEVNYSTYDDQPSAPVTSYSGNLANNSLNYSNNATMVLVGYGISF